MQVLEAVAMSRPQTCRLSKYIEGRAQLHDGIHKVHALQRGCPSVPDWEVILD